MRTPLFKRIAIGCVIALLLIFGYLWTQHIPGPSPEPAARSRPSASSADTLVITSDTITTDTVLATKEPVRQLLPATKAPTRTVKKGLSPDRGPAPADIDQKPVPVCDQLVMRNGDLIDAKILEIGINEIRYRKCRREDGPEYVVLKSDVLSIRYANGDIDRFTRRTIMQQDGPKQG